VQRHRTPRWPPPAVQQTAGKTSGMNKKKKIYSMLSMPHRRLRPAPRPTVKVKERRKFIFSSHYPTLPPPTPRIPKPISSYPFDLIARPVCSIQIGV